MKTDTRKIVMVGVFSALAFVMAWLSNLIPIKVAGFLSYDAKDIIIVIAGFILGPVSALVITVISALLELILISSTGFIGFAMNVISSSAFACTACIIYRKNKTFKGAVIGLIGGVLAMCSMMVLWNYLITPLYMNVSRKMVARMLPTVFLPFNFVKGAFNASLAMLLYKPLVNALRRAGLLDKMENKKSDTKIMLIVVCALIIASSILGFLALGGII